MNLARRTGLVIPGVLTIALGVLLARTLPLTHDESTNWLLFASHGAHYVVTTYTRPNNHVFFTLLQSALPASFVNSDPLNLRVLNLVLAALLVSLMVLWLVRSGVPRWVATIGILASGPLIVAYLGIARGFVLGTLLAFAGIHLLSQPRHRLRWCAVAGLLFALSLWTVPTFVFGMPGLGLLLLLRRRFRDLVVWGGTAVVVAVVLYLPILHTMLGQASQHGHALGFGGYTAGIVQHTLYLTAWAPTWLSTAAWVVGLVLAGAWARTHRGSSTDTAVGPADLYLMLAAYSISDLVIIEVGNGLGLMHAPYFRNSLFVCYTLVLLILRLCARGRGWLRVVAMALVGANAVAAVVGIGLLVTGRDYADRLYDNVILAAPPPAMRHVASTGATSIGCSWRDIPVCRVYAPYLRARHVTVTDLVKTPMDLKCLRGSVRPMPGHSVVVLRHGQTLGQLCQR